MHNRFLLLISLLAGPLPLVLTAATAPAAVTVPTTAQFSAWIKTFPAAAATDSVKLRGFTGQYDVMVKQVTPATARKLLPRSRTSYNAIRPISPLCLKPRSPPPP